jgi:hypothetical protein
MTGHVPAVVASAVGGRAQISIRLATPADGAALARLALLAGRRAPAGPVLLAEADGELVAAVGPHGAPLSDPFRVTLDLVELLELRASQLRAVAA